MQLKLKVREMVSSSSENIQERQNLEPEFPQFSFIVDSHKSVFKTPKKDDSDQNEGDSEQKKGKFNMSKLCSAFIEKYGRNVSHPIPFESKDLVGEFNVKQRRVYDLMNIMQGCACIRKAAKGKYQWIGVNRTDFDVLPIEKGQSSSLRQIAFQIKKFVFQFQSRVNFNQIYDALYQEISKVHEVNPTSLRRRIYECCKVLISLKLIRRVKKDYEWIQPGEQFIQRPPSSTNKSLIRRPRRLQMNEDQIIAQILRKYTTTQQFQGFVQKLQRKYEQKKLKNKRHMQNQSSQMKQEIVEVKSQMKHENEIKTTIKKLQRIFEE